MNSIGAYLERKADQHLPYIGHYPKSDVVLLRDGSYLIMGAIKGNPHELASDTERAGTAKFLNTMWRQIAHDTVTLGIHLVRTRRHDQLPEPQFHNDFARRFNRAYRDHILDEVYRNIWFISVIISPRLAFGNQKEYSRELSRILDRFRFGKKTLPDDSLTITQLEDIWLTLARTLHEWGIRRLGVREEGGYLYSEIAEALRTILYCKHLPIGLVDGPLGNSIYTDRAVFERRHYRILHPEGVRFGTLFGLREYMADTIAGMLDKILPLQMELVMSQSFGFLPRQQAITRLARKQNQMLTSNDRAYAQVTDIDNALSEIAGGETVRGHHHFSVAVYGNSYEDLNRKRGDARAALSNAGAVVAEESIGNESAWWAQLPKPGTEGVPRPGVISSRNLGHLVDFGSYPEGSKEGRWGSAALRFRTVGHTAYDFIPHTGDAGDNGMTLICGITGGGKTTWLMAYLTTMDACLEEDGLAFFFDRDCGGKLAVEAANGVYVEIRAGEPSGLAPLRGLQNTPADREFLERWIKALIMLDGHGPIPPQDDARIARGVKAIMRMPIELRSFEGLRQFLPWRDTHGAGVRLDRWCRNHQMGWAFDGEEDEVAIAARMMGGTRMFGFDLTSILDNSQVITPAAQYLLYRIMSVSDGRRGILSMDECQAYIPHEAFMELTENGIRRGRKNNWVIILSTQHPEDLMVGTFGTVIIEDVQTKIFFRNPEAHEDVYRDKLKLSEGEFRAITERMLPGSRQCLIKRPDGSVIIDFDLSPIKQYVGILSSRKNTVRYAEELRQRQPTWVEPFMETFETAARD